MSNNSNKTCKGGGDRASNTTTSAGSNKEARVVYLIQRTTLQLHHGTLVKEKVMQYAGASSWLADMTMAGPPVDGV